MQVLLLSAHDHSHSEGAPGLATPGDSQVWTRPQPRDGQGALD